MTFSANELCNIIKTSHKAKLNEFKYGDLYLSFRPKREVAELPGQEVKQIDEIANQKAILHDELELRDSQVADLALEDPVRLEEMLARNELETEDLGDLNGRLFDGQRTGPDIS